MPAQAYDDDFAIDEGDVLTGDLFADNGAGPDTDTDPLIIESVNGAVVSVGSQITLASGALLTVNADGTFSYDQNGAFDYLSCGCAGYGTLTADDTFTYALAGGGTATVTITVDGVDSDGDVLIGTDYEDPLDGGFGADIMTGGLGDDAYYVDDSSEVVIELRDEGLDAVFSEVSYSLYGGYVEFLLLLEGDINGTGNGSDNYIVGSIGNNVINGGKGADIMDGGPGDDTYYVDNESDYVFEDRFYDIGDPDLVAGGHDRLFTSVSYSIYGGYVDELILTGTAAIDATGNGSNNVITGNVGNNVINGGKGADAMAGGMGDDTFYVDNLGDAVTELKNQGMDTVFSAVSFSLYGSYVENLVLRGADNINGTGNGSNNTITGNIGANVINGGKGADVMIGGLGDDTYYVDDSADVVTELKNQGADTVYSSVSYSIYGGYVENLILTGMAAISATGNGSNNTLTGNDAANLLNGGKGADVMIGGKGDDTYIVDNIGDMVIEKAGLNSGVDTVRSAVTFSLSGQYAENLFLTGTAAIDGTGNSLNNTITGNAAANTLNGGKGDDVLDGYTGADTLIGGLGDDTYVVDNIGDVVIEVPNAGVDTVNSYVGFSLFGQYIENLTLIGSLSVDGTGNSLANTIIGNVGDNVLNGGRGDDVIQGFIGQDTLIGGQGADVFVYAYFVESSLADFDLITDLSDEDTIDLSAVDAKQFEPGDDAFSLVDAFTGTQGEMTIHYDAGTDLTIIQMDISGDGQADMQITASGDHSNFTNFVF